MPDIPIRGFDAKTLSRLKARAKCNSRSLQDEAKLLLEQAAGPDKAEFLAMARKWRKKFKGRQIRR